MWLWGAYLGTEPLRGIDLERPGMLLAIGLLQSFLERLRFLNRWWNLALFDCLKLPERHQYLAFEDAFSHPEYVVKDILMPHMWKLTCKKRKGRKEVNVFRTVPKTWLVFILDHVTTNIGLIRWPRSASRAASLSASAREQISLVDCCSVTLMDRENSAPKSNPRGTCGCG